MSTYETVSFRPVSYSQHTGSSQSPERRPTVHFDDISALHREIEPATPAKKPTFTSNSSAVRSAARVTMPVIDGASQPTHLAPQACGNIELTAVDKTWGRLFEFDGQPTKRLGEVMHSLARYILHAFPSSESIVLVPSKLASFYNFHGVHSDPFQYQSIFQSKDKDQNRRIAELYQDLGCSYHLVQVGPGSRPQVPGLTPDGFTRWMALHLQAFPDSVFKRLDRIISDFPLDVTSVLDGKTERLPKQLSRYLLPSVPDRHVRSLLQQAVKRHFGESALLTFLLPSEKSELPPMSSLANPPSSSSSTTSTDSSTSATRRRDQRQERHQEHFHRASDSGSMSCNIEKLLSVLNRRHTSYSGPETALHAQSEPARDRRSRSVHVEREPDHKSRRPHLPSRSYTYPRGTESETKSHLGQGSGEIHSYRHHHHRKDSERRSASRDSSRHSLSRSSHEGNGEGKTRHSKYPPSKSSYTHATSSTTSSSITESTRSTSTTVTSVRRAADPKVHDAHTTLPEIHHADLRSTVCDTGRVRGTKDKVDSNGRASCIGLPASESAHVASSASRKDSRGRSCQDATNNVREHDHGYCMERRVSGNGEDRDYRLYSSSSTMPPPASAPVRQRSSTKACQEAPPTLRVPLRPAMSLCATVTTLEHELAGLAHSGGRENDQTWGDFMRSSPRVAFVS